MKTILLLGFSILVFAYNPEEETLKLRCGADSVAECQELAQKTFDAMSCDADVKSNSCFLANEVDGDGKPNGQAIYCEVHSKNCSEAKPYLFGGTYCPSNTTKDYLDSYTNKLTLGYYMGFGGWVTKVCKEKAGH